MLGVDTVSAASGREAIEMIGERRCDAMLLDIMMPGMSGYDVLQWLRDDNRLADLPVIVISAVDDMESVVRCIEMGAEDYLTKPFDPVLLKARLHATLEKKQLARQGETATRHHAQGVRQVRAGTCRRGHPRRAGRAGAGAVRRHHSVCRYRRLHIAGGSMPPPKVVDMLNEYFAALTRPLDRHGGVLTQFQGDAILVTFNVPVPDPAHADNAVQVAFEIQRTLKERTFAGNRLRTRIGIATGEVVSGSVGSGDRINYTVQGNAVNLAARLEELNKQYGSYTLISGDTVAALTRKYATEALGEIEVRGMQAPVAIHRLEV